MSKQHLCEICHEPMPKGEEMFRYHGYSGPCPQAVLSALVPPNKALLRRIKKFVKELTSEKPGAAQEPK